MGYSREEILEEIDTAIVNLCGKCRTGSINESTAAIAHALADLIEVRTSMPDWKDKPGTTTST